MLFKTFFIGFDSRSLDNLRRVATHPVYKFLVETVACDGRSIGDFALAEGFDYWYANNAGSGLGLSEENRISFLHSFTIAELEEFYREYTAYVLGQRRTMEVQKAMLVELLPKLPKLKQLRHSTSQPQSELSQPNRASWQRSSGAPRIILEEPGTICMYNNSSA